MESCQQLFCVCNKLLARAVTACLPSSNLQSLQQIAVSVRNKSSAMQTPMISITGKHEPWDAVLRNVTCLLCLLGSFTSCVLRCCITRAQNTQIAAKNIDQPIAACKNHAHVCAVSDTGTALPDDLKVKPIQGVHKQVVPVSAAALSMQHRHIYYIVTYTTPVQQSGVVFLWATWSPFNSWSVQL